MFVFGEAQGHFVLRRLDMLFFATVLCALILGLFTGEVSAPARGRARSAQPLRHCRVAMLDKCMGIEDLKSLQSSLVGMKQSSPVRHDLHCRYCVWC